MRIFFNDTPFRLVGPEKAVHPEHYQVHIHAEMEDFIPSRFVNHVLITHASQAQVVQIVNFLGEHLFHDAKSITVEVDEYEDIKEYLKSQFKIIKAAGGIVRKSDKILLIYRYNRWDLPKGKLEKNEKPKQGALREVEEECNIKVRMDQKIGNTWHTYTLNGRKILKKTSWYSMDCLDDKKMTPQQDEGIEDLKWMKSRELYDALNSSYSSTRHIFQKYQKKEGLNFRV